MAVPFDPVVAPGSFEDTGADDFDRPYRFSADQDMDWEFEAPSPHYDAVVRLDVRPPTAQQAVPLYQQPATWAGNDKWLESFMLSFAPPGSHN